MSEYGSDAEPEGDKELDLSNVRAPPARGGGGDGVPRDEGVRAELALHRVASSLRPRGAGAKLLLVDRSTRAACCSNALLCPFNCLLPASL